MRRLTTFTILVALGLTVDRGFNNGEITVELAAAFEDARAWTIRSGGRATQSLYLFGKG